MKKLSETKKLPPNPGKQSTSTSKSIAKNSKKPTTASNPPETKPHASHTTKQIIENSSHDNTQISKIIPPTCDCSKKELEHKKKIKKLNNDINTLQLKCTEFEKQASTFQNIIENFQQNELSIENPRRIVLLKSMLIKKNREIEQLTQTISAYASVPAELTNFLERLSSNFSQNQSIKLEIEAFQKMIKQKFAELMQTCNFQNYKSTAFIFLEDTKENIAPKILPTEYFLEYEERVSTKINLLKRLISNNKENNEKYQSLRILMDVVKDDFKFIWEIIFSDYGVMKPPLFKSNFLKLANSFDILNETNELSSENETIFDQLFLKLPQFCRNLSWNIGSKQKKTLPELQKDNLMKAYLRILDTILRIDTNLINELGHKIIKAETSLKKCINNLNTKIQEKIGKPLNEIDELIQRKDPITMDAKEILSFATVLKLYIEGMKIFCDPAQNILKQEEKNQEITTNFSYTQYIHNLQEIITDMHKVYQEIQSLSSSIK